MLKRQTAIGMISELYLPTPRLIDAAGDGRDALLDRPLYLINYYENRYATGTEVADNIRKLAQLGRTARWQAAIDRWARMVQECGDNIDSIRHSFIQGMIYAGHASE
jgi:hypothetical protein